MYMYSVYVTLSAYVHSLQISSLLPDLMTLVDSGRASLPATGPLARRLPVLQGVVRHLQVINKIVKNLLYSMVKLNNNTERDLLYSMMYFITKDFGKSLFVTQKYIKYIKADFPYCRMQFVTSQQHCIVIVQLLGRQPSRTAGCIRKCINVIVKDLLYSMVQFINQK